MRCIGVPIGSVMIHSGTYSLVISVDGTAPTRQATIIDGWGGLQLVSEQENGRWRLAAGELTTNGEFVLA
jgi:hypothetical protein